MEDTGEWGYRAFGILKNGGYRRNEDTGEMLIQEK